MHREHIQYMARLDDGILQPGLDQIFLDIPLAVMVHQLAQLRLQHGGLDEVLECTSIASFLTRRVDHQEADFWLTRVE